MQFLIPASPNELLLHSDYVTRALKNTAQYYCTSIVSLFCKFNKRLGFYNKLSTYTCFQMDSMDYIIIFHVKFHFDLQP